MINTEVLTDSERYFFTVYRKSRRYEGGIRYLFCEELTEYTFFPYTGDLETVLEYWKERSSFKPVNIVLWNDRVKLFEKVSCTFLEEQKHLYITEDDFNRYWKRMCDKMRVGREGTGRVDLGLLSSPGRSPFINDKGRIEYRSREVDLECQRLISRRANAMNDNRICFVYDQRDRIVHDKSCPLAEFISCEDFGALERLPEGWEICEHCKRRVYVRESIGRERKKFFGYLSFLDQGDVSDAVLERVLHEGKARLYMPAPRELEIIYGEDRWLIVRNKLGGFTLYHNNYEMLDERERCITNGFHQQRSSPAHMEGMLEYIAGYDWHRHLEDAAEKAAAEAAEPETGLS